MSLLGATGLTGDIWSTGAFSFESPLKDLLDSGEYTLEQLLAEDELLQELRGVHTQLIEYFSSDEAITKLVKYVILPTENVSTTTRRKIVNGVNGDKTQAADNERANDEPTADNNNSTTTMQVLSKPKEPGEWLQQHLEANKSGKTKTPEEDPEMRYIRFPYMACEIICCEIKGVIDTLVDGHVVSDDPVVEQIFANDHGDDDDENAVASVEVVGPKPRRILDLLFSLLYTTEPGKLDDYRAGYFDKILTVLFRKRPDDLTAYINNGGGRGRTTLMKAMFQHLYSHSIMQIAQRLLLPPRPSPQGTPDEEKEGGEEQEGEELLTDVLDGVTEVQPTIQCDWSGSDQALDLLLDTLIGPDEAAQSEQEEERRLDLSLNASEVLITIIQNSMLSSKTMLSLTSSETIARLVAAATILKAENDGEEYFSPHESLLTSAMNVLESLILQLGGYGAVGTMTLLPEDVIGEQQEESLQPPTEEEQEESRPTEEEKPSQALEEQEESEPAEEQDSRETLKGEEDAQEEEEEEEPLIADLSTMLEHLPRLLDSLSKLLRHPSTKKWTSPMQFAKSEPQQLLGSSRLRIVRVLESLVLLGDPEVDSKLVQSDCLEICLDLFWEFQWCSMLHQSVANLLVHVFEGQNARIEVQEYFLVKCNLLGRLLDSFLEVRENPRLSDIVMNMKDVSVGDVATSSIASEQGSSSGPLPVSEDDVDAALEKQEAEAGAAQNEPSTETGGSPNDVEMTSVEQVSTEAVQFESRDASTIGAAAVAQSFRFGYMGHVIIICQALVHACTMEDGEMSQQEGAEAFEEANGEHHTKDLEMPGGDEDLPAGNEGASAYQDDEDLRAGNEGASAYQDEPLLLAELVRTHPLADRWNEFVATTLATETAIQSTPLGGYTAPGHDPLHSHRPGLADEGDIMGDDGSGPPAPPRGMLGGGDVIDMDDNDLDIAASMMAGLSIGRPSNPDGEDSEEGSSSGDSERSYNSGETAKERGGYLFDDPLGKTGGLGMELGKLTQYRPGEGSSDEDVGGDDDDDDDDSSSSSDEEPESDSPPESDVPVMDLFAGNFNVSDHAAVAAEMADAVPPPDWSNFANFEEVEDAFGPFSSAGEPSAPDDDQDHSASQEDSSKSAEIEELFGTGDHASLLEDDDPASAEPVEAKEAVSEEKQAEEAPGDSGAAVESVSAVEQQASGNAEPAADEPVSDLSDELEEDAEKVEPAPVAEELDIEKEAPTPATKEEDIEKEVPTLETEKADVEKPAPCPTTDDTHVKDIDPQKEKPPMNGPEDDTVTEWRRNSSSD